MKILIIKNGEKKEVYHHPRDIQFDRIGKTIHLGSTDPEIFKLKQSPELKWKKCENSNFDEIFVEFVIE